MPIKVTIDTNFDLRDSLHLIGELSINYPGILYGTDPSRPYLIFSGRGFLAEASEADILRALTAAADTHNITGITFLTAEIIDELPTDDAEVLPATHGELLSKLWTEGHRIIDEVPVAEHSIPNARRVAALIEKREKVLSGRYLHSRSPFESEAFFQLERTAFDLYRMANTIQEHGDIGPYVSYVSSALLRNTVNALVNGVSDAPPNIEDDVRTHEITLRCVDATTTVTEIETNAKRYAVAIRNHFDYEATIERIDGDTATIVIRNCPLGSSDAKITFFKSLSIGLYVTGLEAQYHLTLQPNPLYAPRIVPIHSDDDTDDEDEAFFYQSLDRIVEHSANIDSSFKHGWASRDDAPGLRIKDVPFALFNDAKLLEDRLAMAGISTRFFGATRRSSEDEGEVQVYLRRKEPR